MKKRTLGTTAFQVEGALFEAEKIIRSDPENSFHSMVFFAVEPKVWLDVFLALEDINVEVIPSTCKIQVVSFQDGVGVGITEKQNLNPEETGEPKEFSEKITEGSKA